MIKKIVSGAQTGADRAALDAALEFGLNHGGWVPKGRLAEDGLVPYLYDVREMDSRSYESRTKQNVMDSDGTLIVSHGSLTGGSALTFGFARKRGRPVLHMDLDILPGSASLEVVTDWLENNRIEVLNVAGPRASGDFEIYGAVKMLIVGVLDKQSETK